VVLLEDGGKLFGIGLLSGNEIKRFFILAKLEKMLTANTTR